MELIVQSEGKKMLLKVYNIKSRSQREVELTPTAKWPGKGLLGVTIRFDSYEHAEDELLHVLVRNYWLYCIELYCPIGYRLIRFIHVSVWKKIHQQLKLVFKQMTTIY
jgi:hypothetical protein